MISIHFSAKVVFSHFLALLLFGQSVQYIREEDMKIEEVLSIIEHKEVSHNSYVIYLQILCWWCTS